jgi:O-antigen/teichoic acid export membrane protein
MVAPIITIPLTLAHLGEVTFGLWMTISAMTSLLAFADLGLGQSILSEVSRALGELDTRRARAVVTTTYACILLIALVLLPILALIAYGVDWGRQFKLTDAVKVSEARQAIVVAFILFTINIPASLIYKIQIASQKAFAANLWQAAGSMVGMFLIVAAVHLKLSLPYIVAAFLGGPVLVWVLNSICFFLTIGADLRPSPGCVDFGMLSPMVRQSSEFFVLGILLTCSISLDTLIVSKTLDLGSAATYGIALRISALLSLIPTMMYMPLWAANGEAIGRGDFEWVRKTVGKMTVLCPLLTGAIGLPVLLGSDTVLHWWLKTNAGISLTLLMGMLLWAVLQGIAAPRFMVLNSIVIVRPQIWMQAGFVLIGIPAKIIALKQFGVDALPWINCILYMLVILPSLEYSFKNVLSLRIPAPATKAVVGEGAQQ